MVFNNASPHAIFSTPSSDSNENYGAAPAWANNMTQNPAWPADYNTTQFTSPGALQFTPSPTGNGALSMAPSRKHSIRHGLSRLHIAPISAKSRVETQISVLMTLETPPPGVEYLHLPLQTIAKSKLLAKEDVEKSKILELHTMLVCTSAMRNPALKQKALQHAAVQNNLEIQRRAEQQRETGDEDKNDPKLVAEEDKPSNGGEVRICSNCIQRERKRAARKKLKKEEEQQHWERYETERVVVFNSNELLPFKSWEAPQTPPKESGPALDEYMPPDGALQVSAAMRIACYCRHQNEKEGFQVIFTLKDQVGNVVAQDMSDSILITDDHKTHPPSFSAQVSDQVLYGNPVYNEPGLMTSFSMSNMSQHAQPAGFTSSRSTGNLQSLGFGQYNQQSHVHQLQSPGFASQTTSATMTPTNSLSRPGSPTSAGNTGPNKKRKSSSFHRKVPSGLTMTPRVDTSLPPSANSASAVSMMSQFSPTTPSAATSFAGQAEQSYMAIPNNAGPAQFVNSGPSTPNESSQFGLSHGLPLNARRENQQTAPDYYQSLPGSRVNSRAPSPVMSASRPNLAAYARQQMAHGGNSTRPQPYPHGLSQVGSNDGESLALPMIHKITPTEGPVSGGTEVSIYGRDFAQSMQVYFGDQPATAVTFYGDQALLCTSPPGRVGGVQVTVLPAGNVPQYNPTQGNRPIFTYKNANEKVMEMALRFVSQQQTSNSGAWWQFTQQSASRWVQQQINRPGFTSNYEGGNMLASEPALLEETIMDLLETIDRGGESHNSVHNTSAETLLSLACAAGLHRVVGALLARGANPDARDQNGFTPLMHAALHNRPKVFQLLVVRGADAAIRSLSGYTALDVAPVDSRALLQQILLTTPRTRHSRPALHSRISTASFESSTASWDISSASLYDSESYCTDPSRHTSRRSSAHNALTPMVQEQSESDVDASRVAHPPAAMMAWHQLLACQIQQFHQSLQKSMPQFQLNLPPLPNLDDYQDNTMLRRLSAFVNGRNNTLGCSSPAVLSSQPPAYSELFPEKAESTRAATLDEKQAVCEKIGAEVKSRIVMLPELKSSTSSLLSSGTGAAQRGAENQLASSLISWLWVPFLVMATTAIIHAVTPYVTLPSQKLLVGWQGPVLEAR